MMQARKDAREAVERVIRPIVEGQIRGFVKEHPSVLAGVDWYKPRLDKETTFVNSLAKRIVRDLTCGTSTARLAVALLELQADAPRRSAVARSPAENGPGLACALARGVRRLKLFHV
jgi:hypothetical protein